MIPALDKALSHIARIEGELRSLRVLVKGGYVHATLKVVSPNEGPLVVLVDGGSDLEMNVYTPAGELKRRVRLS